MSTTWYFADMNQTPPGDDSNNGLSAAHPKLSPELVTPGNGDTYILAPGFYALTNSINPAGNFTIQGAGIGNSVLWIDVFNQPAFFPNTWGITIAGSNLYTLNFSDMTLICPRGTGGTPTGGNALAFNVTNCHFCGDQDLLFSTSAYTVTNSILESNFDITNFGNGSLTLTNSLVVVHAAVNAINTLDNLDSEFARGLKLNSTVVQITNTTFNVAAYGVCGCTGLELDSCTTTLNGVILNTSSTYPGVAYTSLKTNGGTLTATNSWWDATRQDIVGTAITGFPTGQGLQNTDVIDGTVTRAQMEKMLVSVMVGRTSVNRPANTIDFLDQAGNSVATLTFDPATPGQIAASALHTPP